MTLSELGGLGELVGAIAVLASLIYVARQIRQNTNATRLATLQSARDGLGILLRGLPIVFVAGLLWFVALTALLFVLIVFNRPKSGD
jgi:hypothetical protein